MKDERNTFVKRVGAQAIMIIMTLVFVFGFSMYWTKWSSPLTEKEIQRYEQIARDIYHRNAEEIVTSLCKIYRENENIIIKDSTIVVEPKSDIIRLYRGKVVAKIENGDLTINVKYNMVLKILTSIWCGLLFEIGTILIIFVIAFWTEAIWIVIEHNIP